MQRYRILRFLALPIFNLDWTMFSTIFLVTSKSFCFVAIFIFTVELIFAVGEETVDHYETDVQRHRGRHLVFPTPGSFVPTKVQLITGLGLPMEVDVSMIVGYVMKFNYNLPYNASFLTHPNALSYERSIDPRSGSDEPSDEDCDTDEAMKEAEKNNRETTSRWEIYRVIESALDEFHVSGKGCLLRAVCQVAEVPFEDNRVGLMAELINVLLTPSSTREKYQVSGDQEYHSAEAAGRDNPGKCESLFPECGQNILEYFTETNVIERAKDVYKTFD